MIRKITDKIAGKLIDRSTGMIHGRRFYKKAVLFSLISALFAILFVTIYTQNLHTGTDTAMLATNIRIKVMDVYIGNFEQYIADSSRIAGRNALIGITSERASRGFFASQAAFDKAFSDCMKCGLMNCANASSGACMNPSADMASRINNIINLSAAQLNINTTYAINNITASQKYPFEVVISVDISYNVSDNNGDAGIGGYAVWHRHSIIQETISIIGLYDPMISIATGSNYTRPVIMYNGSCQYNSTCWNLTTFTQYYASGQYRYTTYGTGFLQRYWNDSMPSSCCGIESILDPLRLGNTDYNTSMVDYQYWSNKYRCRVAGDPKILQINATGQMISLDEGTVSRYNMANDSVWICPR
jgi:hypothetical protein